MIKILLVDDQLSFSEALKYTLEKSSEIVIMGSASNGIEALEFCRKQKPDLVLMDLQMPICDGVKGTELLKQHDPKIKVLILTTFDEDEDVARALYYGADGYVLKEIDTMELIAAIKSAVNGLSIMNNDILKKVTRMLTSKGKDDNPKASEIIGLGDRELEIVEYVVDGLSNREIAEKMNYSEGTVKNMLTNILVKAGAKDRTQLAVYAIKNKMV